MGKTLYLTTQGTQIRVDHDAIRVERPSERFVRVPIRQVESVVAYGHITVSTELLSRLAGAGVPIVFLSRSGRFIARVEGPTSGNVLLRVAQYQTLGDPVATLSIASRIVAAKLLNSRTVLLDLAKDRPEQAQTLRDAARQVADLAQRAKGAPTLDHIRGLEGNAAKAHFAVIGALPTNASFRFGTRSRRPPLDPMNALLSYLYALLRIRCAGAAEGVGLDPQAGYLHRLRPGRPSLALDLMEELRAPFADRLALTLVNRRQVGNRHFLQRMGGAWELTDPGRKIVLQAWDAHLHQEVPHHVFGFKTPRGLVPHHQALLLARYLRGDLDAYLPFRVIGR